MTGCESFRSCTADPHPRLGERSILGRKLGEFRRAPMCADVTRAHTSADPLAGGGMLRSYGVAVSRQTRASHEVTLKWALQQ